MAKKETENSRFKEVREFLSGEKEETPIKKKVFQDKVTGQVSLRLPKDICLSKKIDKNSEFEIILNPKEETWEQLKKENLIIRLIKKK